MSYKCGKCSSVQPNGASPEMVIVETREKTYPPRFANKVCIDNGGSGREIVREVPMCPACAAQHCVERTRARVCSCKIGGCVALAATGQAQAETPRR